MAEFLLTKTNSTLRQQERILSLTRLVLCSFAKNDYIFPHLFFLLIYLKILKNELYQKIAYQKIELQELSDRIGELMSSLDKKDNYKLNLAYVEALLLWFYNNQFEHGTKFSLINENSGDKPTTFIKSQLIGANDNLADYFIRIRRERYERLKLDHFINRINLAEPIKM